MNRTDLLEKIANGESSAVRVGTTSPDATREEEQRLYQQSGGLRYGLKPVLGADIEDLRQVHEKSSRSSRSTSLMREVIQPLGSGLQILRIL